MLCFYGASVCAADEDGEQPLRIVCALGHLNFARFLHAKGASISAANDSGEQPIHRAAEAGERERAVVPLPRDARADGGSEGGGRTN